MIEIRDLCKSYSAAGLELSVLNHLSLVISRGEMLAVVGASGAGKSTLLHLLGALDRPTSGVIEMDGVDLFLRSDRELADYRNRDVGFVFQFHNLLSEFSALENVMMPGLIRRMNRKETATRAEQLLNEMGLADRQHHRPGALSGGEQQRVAIARALLPAPRLILADEPTGNLCRHTGDIVFQILRAVNKRHGTTVVMVTHNETLAAAADRTVRIADGRIEPPATT